MAATVTQKATHGLIAAARATSEDKAKWQPAEDVRPSLEQPAECCLANRMWTNMLQTHIHAILLKAEARQSYLDLDTISKLTQRLEESSADLVEVILNLADSDLAAVISFPWKPTAERSLAEYCLHPC